MSPLVNCLALKKHLTGFCSADRSGPMTMAAVEGWLVHTAGPQCTGDRDAPVGAVTGSVIPAETRTALVSSS